MAVKLAKVANVTWPPEYLVKLVENKTKPGENPMKKLCDGLKRLVNKDDFAMKSEYGKLLKKYGQEKIEKYLTDVCRRYEEACYQELIHHADYSKWLRSIQNKSLQLAKLISKAPSEYLQLPLWCLGINPVLQQALENMHYEKVPGDWDSGTIEPSSQPDSSRTPGLTDETDADRNASEFSVKRKAVRTMTISQEHVRQYLLPTRDRQSEFEQNLLRKLAKITIADFLEALSQLAQSETKNHPVYYLKELYGVDVTRNIGKDREVGFERILAGMIKELNVESFDKPNNAQVATVLNTLLGDNRFDEKRVNEIEICRKPCTEV